MKVQCFNCGSLQEGTFCNECGTVLPLPEDIDYFSLLHVERRPFLSEEELKEKHHMLSSEVHPDRFRSKSPRERDIALQRSSSINTAYLTLKDPKERLRYLVNLETRGDPTRVKTVSVAEGTMRLLDEIREACQEADSFLQQRRESTAKIVAASMALEGAQEKLRRRLMEIKDRIARGRAELLNELRGIDREWMASDEKNREKLLRRLGMMSAELAHFSKFDSLIDERLLNLSI